MFEFWMIDVGLSSILIWIILDQEAHVRWAEAPEDPEARREALERDPEGEGEGCTGGVLPVKYSPLLLGMLLNFEYQDYLWCIDYIYDLAVYIYSKVFLWCLFHLTWQFQGYNWWLKSVPMPTNIFTAYK